MKHVTEPFPLPWLVKRVSPHLPGDWLGAAGGLPEKEVFPHLLQLVSAFGAGSGTECPLGHHLVRSLPHWVPPKVKEHLRKLRDSATTVLLLCCAGVRLASLSVGWRKC